MRQASAQSPKAAARGHRWLLGSRVPGQGRAAWSSGPGGNAGHPGPRAEWALSLSVTNTGLVSRLVCLFPRAVSVLLLPPSGLSLGQAPPRALASRISTALLISFLLGEHPGGGGVQEEARGLHPLQIYLGRQNLSKEQGLFWGESLTEARVLSWGFGMDSQASMPEGHN